MVEQSAASSPATRKFLLAAPTPFRLDYTAWCLRRRPDNLVDRFSDGVYRRAVVVGDKAIEFAVRQVGDSANSRLEVEVLGGAEVESLENVATALLTRLLGLDVDLSGFRRLAANDPDLGTLANRFRGLNPPRYPTAFEALVNAVACQQITLVLGIRVLNRLVEAYGPTVGESRAFPRPSDIATVDPASLRALGFSTQKARTVVAVAGMIESRELDLEGLAELDDEEGIARLSAIHGVGRWTAEYVLLRGFGRLRVFPGDDSGLRRGLRRWLGLAEPITLATTRQLLDRWSPYAGLVYLHLLADRLSSAGYLE